MLLVEGREMLSVFWVGSLTNWNAQSVDGTEDVHHFLVDALDHLGQKERERTAKWLVLEKTTDIMPRGMVTYAQPMLQPTTPQLLPIARHRTGNISAGYSHGTWTWVNQNTVI
jgi:hypothetical protein